MIQKVLFALIISLLVALLVPVVLAQSENPTPTPGPVSPPTPIPDPTVNQQDGDSEIPLFHVVAEGETLTSIAELYETTVELIQQLNGIEDPSLLSIGQELLIPGGGGELVATVHVVQVGESLLSLAAAYSSTVENIAADNRLVKVNNLVAGQPLSILSRTGTTSPIEVTGLSYVVEPGDTLLSLSVEYGLAPAQILEANELRYPGYIFPTQRLSLPVNDRFQPLPGTWRHTEMSQTPIMQGESAVLYIESEADGDPRGTMADQELRFIPYENGYLAIFGLDAFIEPGVYTLEVTMGSGIPFNQDVLVTSGNYGTQFITIPPELEGLLAPEIRAADEAILAQVFGESVEEPLWSDKYILPVQDVPISAGYGAARSYNEGPVEIFHTGVDFAGAIGTPIVAPAPGKIVFSDTLPLHGTTLVLDHGLGVMTAYYHLSDIQVTPGQMVTAGEQIASGGSTGLSSGPHLHWDLRIHNVPVNGLQWVEQDLIGQLFQRASTDGESGAESS